MTTITRPLLGANPERARSHNRQLVLGTIRATGTIGRAEIARRSGLSTQAVSNIISDLLVEGLLCEQGQRSSGRGMPVQLYAIQPQGGYGFGVEIRPKAVFSALIDLGGQPVATKRTILESSQPATVIKTVQSALDDALTRTGLDKSAVLGAGIVMPGPFGKTGLQKMGSELPGWQDTQVDDVFAINLDMPVFVENDANAAAMAERVSGAAQDLNSFAYLYFGQGLGLGLIQNGQLVRGAFGNAGEIGHIPVSQNGQTRLLEDSVSRLSVERHMQKAGHPVATMEDLAALLDKGNVDLRAWLDHASDALAPALAIVENLFDPETIILGGAMPDLLLDQLIDRVALPQRSVSHRPDRSCPRLIKGTSGRMTATFGAAALVLNQAFTPTIAA